MTASRHEPTPRTNVEPAKDRNLQTTKPGGPASPSADVRPLFPGQIVAGRYEVERVLGVGGMGVVASAMHLELHERVAIKAMLPEAAANREYATRFAREAQAAARIRSEFVVRVTDVVRLADGTPAMVMEYLEGHTVAQMLDEGPLEVEDAVDLVLQVCAGLAEAHRHGIVHRDIKPANLFLATGSGEGPTIKILDFGISKSEEHLSITRTRGAIGTPTHMSPEQLRSANNVLATADIWSLGVVLYELLTGELPFEAPSFADLCALVLGSEPPSPRWFRADLPDGLEAVILRCLKREATDRFGSALELAVALLPFASADGAALVDRIERIGTARSSLPSPEEGRVSGFHVRKTTRPRLSLPSLPPAAPKDSPLPPSIPLGAPDDVADVEVAEPTPRAGHVPSRALLLAAGVVVLGLVLAIGLLLASRDEPTARPRRALTFEPTPGPTGAEVPAPPRPTNVEPSDAAAVVEPAAPPPASATGQAPRSGPGRSPRTPAGSPVPAVSSPAARPPASSGGPRFEDFGGRR